MLRGFAVAGVALGLSCLTVVAAGAATRVPNPPRQVCIGSKCATTPTAGGKVKWNPGHYGASAGIAFPGDSISKFSPEMDDMLKDDWVVGYRLFITWSALDQGPVTFTGSVGGATSGTLSAPVNSGSYWASFSDGEYRQVTVSGTTSVSWSGALPAGTVATGHFYTTDMVDQMLARLKTRYNKSKQLVITVVPMSFSRGTRSSDDFSRVPRYITIDPAYGPSPDGRSYGWWGPPPGQTSGAYTAAVYRPAVAAQYAALGQALGAKYNSEPNFEAIMDQENSAVTGPAINFPPKDGTFSGPNYMAAAQSYLSAWVQAFPNTSVVHENTFLYSPTDTQQMEQWMIENRVAPGSSDTAGQSYYSAHGLNGWGLAAYAGQTVSGSSWKGQDYRPIARAMVDVEGGNIGSLSGGGQNNTPQDLVNGLNQTVKASHAFWCHVPSGKTSAPSWSQVTAVLKANPLTATDYPGNYPQ